MLSTSVGVLDCHGAERMRIIRKISPDNEIDDFPPFPNHPRYRSAEVVRITEPERRRNPCKVPVGFHDV